ncbi:hypothetical protein SEA_ZUKO_101 [Streptomyces phage Zuko]|uniref:Uncharacterized protein n=1 Tax=Streptomyces phage Zuko TaxID=2601695 RepID=A0A5J6D7A4_9CAUD|nr:hypothetical protein PP630_gp101 [Streptomyces phage Zuko]QEQ93679.1 hypothetical protein SEA_ZUKO_101 [Streptomyces phage Zuko]
MATPTQTKIAEIMGTINLEAIAQEMVDVISGKVCDHADLIALAQMEERNITDADSHEAHKIYKAAEAALIDGVLRHMKNIQRGM